MYALDFEYDGQSLSEFGFIICDFNAPSGADIVSAGSTITFNTVPMHNGKKFGLSGTQYSECIQSSFHICKNPDTNDDMRITDDEFRELMRWLNRREYLPFQVLYDEDYEAETCYYDASFNIGKIEINKILYGLELTMMTNRPFGYGEDVVINWNMDEAGKEYVLSDTSDEIGYIYPDLTITCYEDGDITLSNKSHDCDMVIRNCKQGEVITIIGEPQIILSSDPSHAIYNDFNFQFFRIGNSYEMSRNVITSTLKCGLHLRYSPIIKNIP